jgi:sucrose-6-phosphatase
LTETNIRLFASDLDGTLLGDKLSLKIWQTAWRRLDPNHRPLLALTSGRLLHDVERLVESGQVPEPDYIISGVGTNIHDYRAHQTLRAFDEILEEGWHKPTVEQILAGLPYEITAQPRHFQHDFKSSWYLNDATADQLNHIERALEEADLFVNVVYSSSRHLDVLPKWANKGNALQWLISHLGLATDQVLVAGDSGNDSAMFQIDGVMGIVVGNAQPELLQVTDSLPVFKADMNRICAAALIDGFLHYGLFRPDEISGIGDTADSLLETLQLSEPEALASFSAEQLELIRFGYRQAIVALKKNITPLGFSACSLTDNDSIGTDVNYRSVWARDGAITILGSLPLTHQDESIRHCQEKTFETILSHVTPNGQLPANVRIEDNIPDYSGVGGIAAIDGGMWLIIAVYGYVQTTGNLEFLRRHIHTLQNAMNWLSAHDSNNDALLEVPEAGDWTDLFGRSYNVLYDEVLWYRANYCFGRLLELLGDSHRAGDYLRWARVIRQEIQLNFWPSSEQRVFQATSFAEQQFELGDARYLIAQITPFDYSWRCDTYGNVLAFLYNVIDVKKASQAFRFMWGVGVNEPFPIANLYPVVHAGDKDWRAYYTVNLLNLPHHYHNGGIWPFIGGPWVRFINKLGLREVALQELHKLAQLNKLGLASEWEFNEWAHGKTGRPMGKAFQAWSAAEYIAACHDLNVVA